MSIWKLCGVGALTLALSSPAPATGEASLHDPPADTEAHEPPAEPEAHEEGAEEAPEDQPSAERPKVFDRVEVRERADDLTGLTFSASEGSTGYLDLQLRPVLRVGELLETAPGMIATQHSGGGKANQYFLRGFNLDHGTDFSVRVAGTPVNMPSHGHGQGYADLNFVIPELVDRVAYRKGPYFSDVGDFSAAGTVEMRPVTSLDEGFVQLTAGTNDFGRVVAAESFRAAEGDLTAALEVSSYDGPWSRPDDFLKINGLLSYRKGDATRGFSITAMGYDGGWLSTDQIPRREVESGRLGRFDLIDPGPRGSTERYSLSAEVHRGRDRSLTSFSGYLLSYDFRLVSNFTYLLEDPVDGDQFEQVDDRIVGGLRAQHDWLASLGSKRLENRAGVELRWDEIDNGLYRTRELERIGTVRQDAIRQLGVGLWADTTIRWSDVVRTYLGLRADLYDARVTSDLAANSGDADDTLLSPKLGLLIGPFGSTELFANLGWGHHSNDARGATIRIDPVTGEPGEPVEPLVRAVGGEVGFRTRIGGWSTSVAVFGLDLDSELVFVGDGGATEASRPSRRRGVEWSNYWRLNGWLALNADLTWTDSEFTDPDPAGSEIPGAISQTVSAGLIVDQLGGFFGSLRWRYFRDIPLIEDGSVTWSSTSLVNLRIGYSLPVGLDLGLEIFNLLDEENSDVEYFYASRLPGEPAEGVEDVHFHPVEPRGARLTVGWRF